MIDTNQDDEIHNNKKKISIKSIDGYFWINKDQFVNESIKFTSSDSLKFKEIENNNLKERKFNIESFLNLIKESNVREECYNIESPMKMDLGIYKITNRRIFWKINFTKWFCWKLE